MPARFWLPLGAGVLLLLSRLIPLPDDGALLSLPSLCFSKALTQMPCPGCGITRSLVCAAHGEWSAAVAFHPLGPLVYFALWFTVIAGVLCLFNRTTIDLSRRKTKLIAAAGASTVFALFTATWLLRLIQVVPFPPNF